MIHVLFRPDTRYFRVAERLQNLFEKILCPFGVTVRQYNNLPCRFTDSAGEGWPFPRLLRDDQPNIGVRRGGEVRLNVFYVQLVLMVYDQDYFPDLVGEIGSDGSKENPWVFLEDRDDNGCCCGERALKRSVGSSVHSPHRPKAPCDHANYA